MSEISRDEVSRIARLARIALSDEELDQIAPQLDHIVDALHRGGTGWASPTVWRGTPTLRLSVCNWQTTAEDIDACAAAIITAYTDTTERPLVP